MTPQGPLPADDDAGALLAEAGWLRAMAGRLARDQAEADDLAQGTLVLALQNQPETRSGLRPWLAKVASRVARHRGRTEARRRYREAEAAHAGTSASAEELFERLEAQERLASLVLGLPAPYAEVVLRRYYEGQTADEIAASMGTSAGTARSRLARGLALLRKSLEDPRTGSNHQGTKLLALAAGLPRPSHAPTAAALIAMKLSTKVAASFAAFVLLLATGIMIVKGSGDAPLDAPPTAPASSGHSAATVLAENEASPADGPTDGGNRTALGAVTQEELAEESASEEPPATTSIVRARLVDTQGQPIEGAVLSSIFKTGKPRGDGNFASADAEGHVVLELADGDLRAWRTEVFPMVFAASFDGRATRFMTATPVWHGESNLGDIELPPGTAISGHVVDPSGRPIPGALIYAEEATVAGDLEAQRMSGPEKDQVRHRADGDSEGRFLCKGLTTGEGRLWVHAKGHLWTLTDLVHLTAGQVLDVGPITLDPVPEELTITGTVLSPEGTPVAGATVAFEARSGDGSIKTAADGTFTIYPKHHLAMNLVASTPDGPYGMSEVAQVLPGDRPKLRLGEKHQIQVTVLNGNGEAVPDASLLTVVPATDNHSGFLGGFMPIPGTDWIKTNAQGQASLPAPGQKFTISVRKDRYEFQRAGPYEAGEAPADVTVTLAKVPTLRGRVTHRGLPVAGAEIQVAMRLDDFVPLEQGFPMRIFKNRGMDYRTDENGRFDCPIEGDTGAMTLLALAEGLATAEFEVDLLPGEGTEGIEIKMTEGGSLGGSLLPPQGEDPQQLIVAASRGDGEVVWTRPDADGHYEFLHLTPGPWRVEGRDREPARVSLSAANSDEEKDFKWNVDIRDGERTSFDVDMRQLGDVEIHGQFTVDGIPAKGWVVTVTMPLHSTVDRDAPVTATEDDGRFLLIVRSGTYHLQIEGELPGGARVKVLRDVTLKGQRLDLDVSLVTGWIEDSVPAGTKQARLVRGNYSRGDRELTEVPVAADGALRARVPVGKASLQTPAGTNVMFDGWRYLRMVEVEH